jgi:SNF2 family DNA or RNA helicase
MGLGKTFQVTVFLACMLRTKSISRVLIVAPVSVLESWKRELHEHLLPHIPKGNGLQIDVASAEMSKKKRISTLRSVFDSKHQQRIIISSYHLVANMTTEFATLGEWDYVRTTYKIYFTYVCMYVLLISTF